MILDLIGWNIALLSFICFLYVATVEDLNTLSEAMPIIVPMFMIVGGLVFGLGTKSIINDKFLSTNELLDGLLWFVVVFGCIATIHVGVVEVLSDTPFKVTYSVMPLKLYGVEIGIAEEILFRGVFLPWLSTLAPMLGVFIGVPASAGAWTLFHLGVYGTHPMGLVLVFMVGITLGFIAWYKQRLWIFMGAHALVNFLAMGGATIFTMLVPLFLVTLVVIIWALRRGRPR